MLRRFLRHVTLLSLALSLAFSLTLGAVRAAHNDYACLRFTTTRAKIGCWT